MQRCAARPPAAGCGAPPGGCAERGITSVSSDAPPARLRRAVPGGLPRGRRSLAVGAVGLGGGGAERGITSVSSDAPPARLRRAVRGAPHFREDCPRPPAAGCADRSAFPCRGGVGLGGGCAERGITSVSSDAPPARLRRAVPTGGRRSLAVGAVGLGGWPARLKGESLPLVAMRRPPACGGLCRAPPGGLPRGRRSLAVGAVGLGGGGAAARPPAAGCADRRSAFPCRGGGEAWWGRRREGNHFR